MDEPNTDIENPTGEPTDAELVVRYRHDGDTEAMTVLIRRYERPLWHAARRVLGSTEDAADAVQSVWVNVLTVLARSEFELWGEVGAWLYRITRNESISRLRRARVRPAEAMPPGVDPAAFGDAFTVADARMVIAQLLDEVPEEQRDAIVLVWLRGLTVAEAAEVLDIPVGTVKSRCSRARKAMGVAVCRGGAITTALDPD